MTRPPPRLRTALHALGALGLATLVAVAHAEEATPPPPGTVAVEPVRPSDASASSAASPTATDAASAPTPPETAPAGVAATVRVETTTGSDDARFDLRTRALEVQVDELKEQIFRTKARLASLAESVLEGGYNRGAKLVVSHRNELPASMRLTGILLTLDGAPLFTKVDETGALGEQDALVVFDQRIVPGEHQINVQYQLRGRGFGVLRYLDDIRLKVTGGYTFTVEAGKVTQVTSVARDKGGLTTPFEEKPDVRFELAVKKDVGTRALAGDGTAP